MRYDVIFSSFVAACGLVMATHVAVSDYKKQDVVVDVKGLSEKLIKADTGTIRISMECKEADSSKLFEKRSEAKNKVLAFLQKHNIAEQEISDIDFYTYQSSERQKEENGTYKDVTYFHSRDKVCVSSYDVNKLKEVYSAQDELLDLSKAGICVSVSQDYKVSDFSAIKIALLKEAMDNARKSAEAMLHKSNGSVGDETYIRQGEISISSPDSTEASWGSSESESIMKKFRLVVRAGFKIK